MIVKVCLVSNKSERNKYESNLCRMSNTSLTKWILEFLGIRGVKFPEIPSLYPTGLGIPRNSNSEH